MSSHSYTTAKFERELSSILPGPDVLENLTNRWAVLVSRVICKHLPNFQHLQKAVVLHIPHKYSSEMKQKSNVVSIINRYISFEYARHWSSVHSSFLIKDKTISYFFLFFNTSLSQVNTYCQCISM
jgi:hypothetical protein